MNLVRSNNNSEDRLPNLSYLGPNRYMCTVLDEMRECIKNLNFSPMLSLVEEAQILASRMEAGLENMKDIRTVNEELHKLKALRKELKEECVEMLEKLKDGEQA